MKNIIKNYKNMGIAFILSCLFLFGCATHIIRTAKSTSIKSGAKIGIIIEDSKDDSQLSSFIGAALINTGFKVKVINPNELIPSKIMNYIRPEYKYSFMNAFTEQIAAGGKFQGKSSVLEKMMKINEMKESRIRFDDLMELTDNFLKRWEMDYIMFVYPGANPYCFMVKIIRISNREMVFTHYVNANKLGWKKSISKPKQTKNLSITKHSESDDAAIKIQFAEHLVNLIK